MDLTSEHLNQINGLLIPNKMLEVSVNITSGLDSLFHAERYFSIQNNFIEKKKNLNQEIFERFIKPHGKVNNFS